MDSTMAMILFEWKRIRWSLLAACGILVLDHLLHDYIVDSEDIQKKLELPVLGLIPEV